ncbi:ATP-grasp domain-containing protein [Thermodesulforhabdus norvegica]|nr:hypothetical protein [Thermodesulforhabdus norvegica]
MTVRRSVVVSYHPVIEGDVNLILADRSIGEEDIYWLRRAKAVILPQGCRPELYFTALRYCPNVFPDYRARFLYPGKTGQIRLFRLLGVPHPKSRIFGSLSLCPKWFWRGLEYPVVVKSSWGGEGSNVYLLKSPDDADKILEELYRMERAGWPGFLVQDYVEAEGRDLRVVVVGHEFFCYWRVGRSETEFRYNLACGSRIEYPADRREVISAYNLVSYLVRRTGINLAGFDIIFSQKDLERRNPLFLEINYFFGRTGLGGNQKYYEILQRAVDRWLSSIP